MPGSNCAILGCPACNGRHKGLTFFSVKRSKNPKWEKALIRAVNRTDSRFNKETATICSRHFKEECFKPNGDADAKSGKVSRQLIPGSLPTEFIPVKPTEPSESETPEPSSLGLVCAPTPSGKPLQTRPDMEVDPAPGCSSWDRPRTEVKLEFRSSFQQSPAYLHWKDVGARQGLYGDEEIACFLLKYYEDTSKVLPSGMPVCKACGTYLSCTQCNWTVRDLTSTARLQHTPSQSQSQGKCVVTVKEEGVDSSDGEVRHPDFSSAAVPVRKMVEAAVTEDQKSQAEKVTDGMKKAEVGESDDITKAKGEKNVGSFEHSQNNQEDDAEPGDDLEEGDNEGEEGMEEERGEEQEENVVQAADVSVLHGLETADHDYKYNTLSAAVAQVAGSCDKTTPRVDQKPFVCGVCNKAFTQAGLLKKHEVIHSGHRPFLCEICSKTFFRAGDLKQHKKIHTEKPHKCDICSKTFIKECYLKAHKVTHTGLKPFMCDMCGKSFTQSGHLNRHKLIHAGKKPFVCDVCDKSFIQANILRSHKKIHADKKSFICDVCSKAFATEHYLKAHKLIHADHKPFMCDVCSKTFTQAINLKSHKMTHTGQKPFVCDVCSKTFSHRSTLMAHKLIHSGQKPYVCDVCSKAFRDLANMKRHKHIHTGQKPHMCDVCSKSFIQKVQLKAHRMVHTGLKPFACDECGKCFTESGTLNKHKKIHLRQKSVTHLS